MDNQHRKISGYRELIQEEIDSMNQVKNTAKLVGGMIEDLKNTPGVDMRWVAIAQTDLQKGFMAAARAVAKPDFF
jgi:hypothetical protein